MRLPPVHRRAPIWAHAMLLLCLAQTASPLQAQEPPSIDSELQRYGIPHNKDALIQALKDKRPEVRGLAAGELAGLRDTQAIPAMRRALAEESDTRTRLNIASALSWMKDEQGLRELSRICSDPALRVDTRMSAANLESNVGGSACLDSVLSMMSQQPDEGFQQFAVLYIASLKNIPPASRATTSKLVVADLHHESSTVRMYASRCLAAIKDTSAADALEKSASRETDPEVKAEMETDLKTLRQIPEDTH